MSALIDIAGKRFGKLVAIRGLSNGPFGKWVFVCDCGREKTISKQNVTQGKVRSCGCMNKENGAKKRLDLLGMRFGRLTVVSMDTTGRKTMCECRCDCGNMIPVAGSYLMNGHTRSCGCRRTYRLGKGEAGLSILYKFRYRDRAKKRGRAFDISLEDFRKLTKMDCHYCGAKPATVIKSKSEHSGYVYNGLDRMDSSKGYTLDNVVPCCEVCNRMKLDHSSKDFAEHIRKICSYWLSKMGQG